MYSLEHIAANGFAIHPRLLGDEETETWLRAWNDADCASTEAGRGGVRNVLEKLPAVLTLAHSPAIRGLIEPVLGRKAFPVRGILFDKTPHANWKVPWHQDLTIAVQERMEVPGFGPWTTKDGVHHVQPPTHILEGMLAVRIHLDECGEDNGPLRVIAGSHARGRLTATQIQALLASSDSISCTMESGGALLMRPLLLHASSAAASPNHRRVLHIEFAAQQLPAPLRWYEQPHPSC
ncbi:MAG: phytanoyl-CoA dioxygenase family protein [Bryobacterales bacterium]|nr:phytanoyl-CoA dioxygenase family protein [Bryobacterales bacterium]